MSDPGDLDWPRVETGQRYGHERHAYRYLPDEDKVRQLCYPLRLKRTTYLSDPTRATSQRPDLVTCGNCRRVLGL